MFKQQQEKTLVGVQEDDATVGGGVSSGGGVSTGAGAGGVTQTGGVGAGQQGAAGTVLFTVGEERFSSRTGDRQQQQPQARYSLKKKKRLEHTVSSPDHTKSHKGGVM